MLDRVNKDNPFRLIRITINPRTPYPVDERDREVARRFPDTYFASKLTEQQVGKKAKS